MKIKEAIGKLDPANDEHWTADGLPRMDAIVELLGGDTSVSRKHVTDAVPGLTREIVQAELVASNDERLEESSDWRDAPCKVDEANAKNAPLIDRMNCDYDPSEELSVLDLPVADVLADAELTDAAIKALDVKANELLKQRDVIKAELEQVYAKCGVLARQKVAHDRRARRLGTKKTNVQEYLAAQARSRYERAMRARKFIDAGTTASDVADQLRGSSKIDTAMSRRKPAPGSQRPAPRVPSAR